jgi:hypothetical protein
VGDDHGDLAAFAAIAAWAGAGTGRVALRVAVASEESPPALLAAADLVVEGPGVLVRDLAGLAGALAA